ncbi:MAG: ABC transporter permease subunit [Candidatus Heimdallarchaeota archaeon]|nr:ABC transporter permease subunit [Candidatus Heimdallarchaeota archaeon]
MSEYLTKIIAESRNIQQKLPAYGRNINIIALQVFKSTIKEKKFYLAAIYFTIFPIILNLFGDAGQVVFSGSGIALFYAQTVSLSMVKTVFLSFFLGQILIIILTADLIAGEVEMKTFELLRSKPVFDSEIVFGKFLGMMYLLGSMNIPSIIIIYSKYLISLEAEFPGAYMGTLDELLGLIIIVNLLQGMIVALTLLFSTIFAKSLYAILSSLLSLFILSTISDSLLASGAEYNYISMSWLLDAVMPYIFYHLEPLENVELPSLFGFVMGFMTVILAFLLLAIAILRNREVQ